MKNAFVVMAAFGLMGGCGPAPAETAWFVRTYNAWCDKVHASLTETQRGVPFSFYLGNNAGDCKAAFNPEIADAFTTGTFSDRKFVQAEADKCTEAITKLATQDVLNLLSRQVNIASIGEPMLQATARKDAFAKLGLPEDFSCQADQTTCRADAGCALSTNSGACARYKWAPYKDGNLAAKEADNYSKSTLAGCGDMAGF